MQTAAPRSRKHDPANTPTRRPFAPPRPPYAVLALFLTLLATTAPAQTRTALTLGVTQTNFNTQLSAGVLALLHPHVATWAALDLGAGATAAQVQPCVLFDLDGCCHLGLLAGPEVLSLQEDPTIEERVQYLNAATAVLFWTDLTPQLSANVLAEYITTDANVSRYRLSIRLAIWLN